jgi:hypothetical protein
VRFATRIVLDPKEQKEKTKKKKKKDQQPD